MLSNNSNQVNPYIQKNYFPIDGKETILESITLSGHPDQLNEFKEFSNFIDEDSLFREQKAYNNAQRVIAFLVEAVKQLYKDDWKRQLLEIKNKISAIRSSPDSMMDPENSYRETTWLLNKLFIDLYEPAVVANILQASRKHDSSEQKFYEQTLKNINLLRIFERLAIKGRRPMPLGGVHNKFVPCWLKEKEVD